MSHWPETRYAENINGATETRYCLFNAMASAFYYCGEREGKSSWEGWVFKRIADILYKNRMKSQNSLKQMEMLEKIILDNAGEALQSQKWSKKKLDILGNVCNWPTSVILLAKDKGVQHAVSIVGNWVFDSSIKNAMPLCRDTLDWCCVSGFEAAHVSICFVPKSKKLWKKYV